MVWFSGGGGDDKSSLSGVYYILRERMVLWESKLRDARHGCKEENTREQITWILDDIAKYRSSEKDGLERLWRIAQVFDAVTGKPNK